MDAKTREKEALFAELYQLDDSGDEGDVAPFQAFAKPELRFSTSQPLTPRVSSSHHSLARTVSAPLHLVPLLKSEDVTVIEDTPPTTAIAAMRRAERGTSAMKRTPISKSFTTSGDAKNTRVPKTGTKRKRGESLEVLPESQKIFTSLSFCKSVDMYQFHD